MKTGWAQSLFLKKRIEISEQNMINRMDALTRALTAISLSVKGVGSELIGTTVTVTNGTDNFTGTFDSKLSLVFQPTVLGTCVITYKSNATETSTKSVVISAYGYYETIVNYFPGYDLWTHWAKLANLNPDNYTSVTAMLQNNLAQSSLMANASAIDYMIASTGGLIAAAVLASTDTIKAMIRSSYALEQIKLSAYWRNAILNNDNALAVIYSTKDVLKTLTVVSSVSGVYAGNTAYSKTDTDSAVIPDEKMLLIAYTRNLFISQSDNGTGVWDSVAHYATATGSVSINGNVNTSSAISTWKEGEYSDAATGALLTYSKIDDINSLSTTITVGTYGANGGGNITAVFYYL